MTLPKLQHAWQETRASFWFVLFSITIVVLSLTSSQYTSRVLRNFLRNRMNQIVLGVFVGICVY